MDWNDWDEMSERDQWRVIGALILRTTKIRYGNVAFRIVPDPRTDERTIETREMRETFKDNRED